MFRDEEAKRSRPEGSEFSLVCRCDDLEASRENASTSRRRTARRRRWGRQFRWRWRTTSWAPLSPRDESSKSLNLSYVGVRCVHMSNVRSWSAPAYVPCAAPVRVVWTRNVLKRTHVFRKDESVHRLVSDTPRRSGAPRGSDRNYPGIGSDAGWRRARPAPGRAVLRVTIVNSVSFDWVPTTVQYLARVDATLWYKNQRRVSASHRTDGHPRHVSVA